MNRTFHLWLCSLGMLSAFHVSCGDKLEDFHPVLSGSLTWYDQGGAAHLVQMNDCAFEHIDKPDDAYEMYQNREILVRYDILHNPPPFWLVATCPDDFEVRIEYYPRIEYPEYVRGVSVSPIMVGTYLNNGDVSEHCEGRKLIGVAEVFMGTPSGDPKQSVRFHSFEGDNMHFTSSREEQYYAPPWQVQIVGAGYAGAILEPTHLNDWWDEYSYTEPIEDAVDGRDICARFDLSFRVEESL